MQMSSVSRKVVVFLMISIGALALSSCASTPHTENAGQYVEASGLTWNVKSGLLADKHIDSLHISVKTFKRTVTLSGYVSTLDQKQRAVSIARRTHGVWKVIDAIQVKTS